MRGLLLGLAVACYLIAVLFLRPAPTPGPAMRDFEAYYAAGATWRQGRNAYGEAIWSAERRIPGVDPARVDVLPYINPPLLLPIMALLSLAPYATATVLWGSLLGFALLLLALESLGLARLVRDPPTILAALVLALAFGPLSSDLALGQLALIAVAATVLATAAFHRSHAGTSAVGAVIAALQPTLAVPMLAWVRSRRALHLLLAGAIAFLLFWTILAATSNAPTLVTYLALVRAHAAAEGLALIQFSPAAIAAGFGLANTPARILGAAVALLALATWLLLARRLGKDTIGAFALGCAFVPFIVSFVHEHDFTLLLPALIIALARAHDLKRRSLVLSAAVLIGVDWLGLAQRPDGVLQSLFLVCALLAATLALVPVKDHAKIFIAPLALIGLLVVAGAIAQHHPAPIWPDAMHSFHLASNASIASRWHAEQRACGMFAVDPFFAILRCGPLLGCALLALAIAL